MSYPQPGRDKNNIPYCIRINLKHKSGCPACGKAVYMKDDQTGQVYFLKSNRQGKAIFKGIKKGWYYITVPDANDETIKVLVNEYNCHPKFQGTVNR
ncbi:MAG: hypothetical protein FWE53_00565 [Firmicutes bacterium]|nr:hypothetical protein [Bacillota bacterium]